MHAKHMLGVFCIKKSPNGEVRVRVATLQITIISIIIVHLLGYYFLTFALVSFYK